jgi:NADH-quinone oxidoreductase subunit C
MSIVEETRIALLELFPSAAAADAEARAAAQAEAEERAAAEAAAAEQNEDEMEAAPGETDSMESASESDGDSPAEGNAEVEAESAEAAPEPEPEEPEEEGPRENGVMLTDHAARGTAIDVLCDPDQVGEAAVIMDQQGFYLESITGVDWIKDEKMEVIYDYNQFGMEPCRVAVRTFLSRTEPEIMTISDVVPSANWHERETHDFYGIKFSGHPHLIPILLPEDSVIHPLLKDFKP